MKDKQRRLSHQEKVELFELFETGNYTGKQLSELFPISQVSINTLLKRNGYDKWLYLIYSIFIKLIHF